MVGVFRVSPPPGPITQIEIQKIEEFKFLVVCVLRGVVDTGALVHS